MLIGILKGVLAFLLLLVVWIGLLWFGIAPNFMDWSVSKMLAVHLLPPVFAWIGWRVFRFFVKQRRLQLAEAQERQINQERQEHLQRAREKYEAELQERRYACDCRAVAFARLMIHGEFELPESEYVGLNCIALDEERFEDNLLSSLQPAIKDVLSQVYMACTAAAGLPVYLKIPGGIGAAEAIALVQVLRQEVIDELELPLQHLNPLPPVAYFVAPDTAINGAIELFRLQPDLPGALILGFDAPWVNRPLGVVASEAGASGMPSQGVVALLLTHIQLAQMVESLGEREQSNTNEQKAYWENELPLTGNLALLGSIPLPLRKSLLDIPIMARLHQAVIAEQRQDRGFCMTYLLEKACVNAALLEQPFSMEPPSTEAEQPLDETKAPEIKWWVHNAGSVGNTGSRLAEVAHALTQHKITLDLLEEATDVAGHIGDLGEARSLIMLGLCAARTCIHSGPVLLVEFNGTSISAGLTVPVNNPD